MMQRFTSIASVMYLVLCLVLGGSGAAGAIANAVLQIAALLIILILIWSRNLLVASEARPLGWVVGLLLLWGLVSLVPLPTDVWRSLPFRGYIADSLRLLRMDQVSLPISLAPASTIASLLWLLPPSAMFLLTVGLSRDAGHRLGATILVLAVLSIILGVSQLLGGVNSSLRPYAVTNSGSPVGFFANVNHQVTLILCAFPFAAVVASRFATGADRSKRSGGLIIAATFALFLTAGVALAGSVAGYGLFLPAAFASLLIYRRATVGRLSAAWKASLGILVVLFVGVALVGPVSQESLSGKFSASPDSRRHIAATTAKAISDSFPIGTGLGTFVEVYRRYEDPQQVTREYTNHAHNDYLELLLETGVVGLMVLFLFLVWWFRRSLAVWHSDQPGMHLARAGSLVIAVVLLHSIVDYPLRTSAIAAVFAVACGFLVPSSGRQGRRRSVRSDSPETLNHLEAEA